MKKPHSCCLYICGDIRLIGGIEKYNTDFVDALNSTQLDLKLITRKQGGTYAKLKLILEALQKAISCKPNYVFCGHLNFVPIALLLYLFLGVPYSVNLYGIETIKVSKILQRLGLRLADRVIVISHYTKDLLRRQNLVFEDKISLLPSAVDGEKYKIMPQRNKLKKKYGLENRFVLLTLSRLSGDEQKGQHRVLEALASQPHLLSSLTYIIAGPGVDPRVDEVFSKYPQLKDNVLRLPNVSDEMKVELYNLSDSFILPSKNEGFGIVFIEAMACGLPVIASDGYGCREALEDGRLGHLVDPNSCENISGAISQAVFSNNELYALRGQDLRKACIAKFGIENWKASINTFVADMMK